MPCAALVVDMPIRVKPYPNLMKLFDYEHDAPINARLNPLVSNGGIQVSEIQYDDPLGGDPPEGYLVESGAKSPQAAVVFIHSEGRNDFLPEAIFLARLGAITISLDSPIRKSYPEQMQHTVIAVRRAFDYLASRRDVDPRRYLCCWTQLWRHDDCRRGRHR